MSLLMLAGSATGTPESHAVEPFDEGVDQLIFIILGRKKYQQGDFRVIIVEPFKRGSRDH